MTEIRVDVDLPHPPERAWRALTEARFVTHWLPTTHFVVTEDGHFTVDATELAGVQERIEGRIETVERPRRLVMRWESPNLHTLVTVSLQATGAGCRLTVVQRGFVGAHGAMRRRVLQRAYTDLLGRPLALTLNRIAAEEEAERRAASGPPPPAGAGMLRRNDGRPFQRPSRPADRTLPPPRSASAPGLSSTVRPEAASAMPGFAAAMLGAAHATAEQAAVTRLPAQARASAPDLVEPAGALRVIWWRRLLLGAVDLLQTAWEWARRPSERRGQAVAAAAALLLLLAIVALLIGVETRRHPAGPPHVGGARDPAEATVPGQKADARAQPPPRNTASAVPGLSATVRMVPSASIAPATAQPSASVATVLSATYRVESTRLSGYTATVTISNPAAAPVDGWTVLLTLPLLGLGVQNTDGAVASQTGKEVTLTPMPSTSLVAPGRSVVVRIDVDGVGQPTACMINGRPCAGLPG